MINGSNPFPATPSRNGGTGIRAALRRQAQVWACGSKSHFRHTVLIAIMLNMARSSIGRMKALHVFEQDSTSCRATSYTRNSTDRVFALHARCWWSKSTRVYFAEIAQLVERLVENQEVIGSIPILGTLRARSSKAEPHPHKVLHGDSISSAPTGFSFASGVTAAHRALTPELLVRIERGEPSQGLPL